MDHAQIGFLFGQCLEVDGLQAGRQVALDVGKSGINRAHAATAAAARADIMETALQLRLPFDGIDDVKEGDILGSPLQGEAAFDTAVRLHDASLGETAHDFQ